MPGPDNQQIVITQGELDALNSTIANLQAENAALKADQPAPAPDQSAEIDTLKTELAAANSANAALLAEINAIKTAVNHTPIANNSTETSAAVADAPQVT